VYPPLRTRRTLTDIAGAAGLTPSPRLRTADYLAGQRAAGKMNPETWPPLVDEERFDVGDETPDDLDVPSAPNELTIDDLD